MDVQDMRWSSANPKVRILPVDFSNEPLGIVLHGGHRKNQPDHGFSRSFWFKQKPTLRKFRQSDCKKQAITAGASCYEGWLQELSAGAMSSCSGYLLINGIEHCRRV
jgi:hypothetical protein